MKIEPLLRKMGYRQEGTLTLDVTECLVQDIDTILKQIGVDRGALIKIWLHERVKQEKGSAKAS